MMRSLPSALIDSYPSSRSKPSMSFHVTNTLTLVDAPKSVRILTDPTPQQTCVLPYMFVILMLLLLLCGTGLSSLWCVSSPNQKAPARRLVNVYTDIRLRRVHVSGSRVALASCSIASFPLASCPLASCPLACFLDRLRPCVRSRYIASNVRALAFYLCNPWRCDQSVHN